MFWSIFSCFASWEAETRADSQKIAPPLSNAKSPDKCADKIHKSSLESSEGDTELRARWLATEYVSGLQPEQNGENIGFGLPANQEKIAEKLENDPKPNFRATLPIFRLFFLFSGEG